MARSAKPVELKKETLLVFMEYLHNAEAEMERTLSGDGPFLWSARSAERARDIRRGTAIAELWSGNRPAKAPEGLIHDWIGAIHVPGATVEKTLAVVQDYDNHKNVYKPQVIDSRLISRAGDDFKIYLRLLKKKILTVVLDTYHDAHYSSLDSTRWYCRSATTGISEVENAGQPSETVRDPDTGFGFLWRLNSYWRFQEADGGVTIECRAVSLTRDVPASLRWLIEPIVRKLPKESLTDTLEATATAVRGDSGRDDGRPAGLVGQPSD